MFIYMLFYSPDVFLLVENVICCELWLLCFPNMGTLRNSRVMTCEDAVQWGTAIYASGEYEGQWVWHSIEDSFVCLRIRGCVTMCRIIFGNSDSKKKINCHCSLQTSTRLTISACHAGLFSTSILSMLLESENGQSRGTYVRLMVNVMDKLLPSQIGTWQCRTFWGTSNERSCMHVSCSIIFTSALFCWEMLGIGLNDCQTLLIQSDTLWYAWVKYLHFSDFKYLKRLVK